MTKSDLIFQQWSASLINKDRSMRALPSNFDELFSALNAEGLSLEEAHKYLPKAIKAHEPTASLIKNTHKKYNVSEPLQEYGAAWLKKISDQATAIFFEIFPVEVKAVKKVVKEIKFYGEMSAEENALQQAYANKFKVSNQTGIKLSTEADND